METDRSAIGYKKLKWMSTFQTVLAVMVGLGVLTGHVARGQGKSSCSVSEHSGRASRRSG